MIRALNGLRLATWSCLLAALCACGDSAGGGGDAPDGGAATGAGAPAMPGACGDFGGDNACASCISEQCCVEASACDTSAECLSLVDCARQCDANASACRANCANDSPMGRGFYNELLLCMGEQCPDECYFATP